MKNLLMLGLFIALFTSCKTQPERWTKTSPEIDAAKSLIKDYQDGNWQSWMSHYADSAKVYHNSIVAVSPQQLQDALKSDITNYTKYDFSDKDIYYEMIIDEKGDKWVYFWGNWEASMKDTTQDFVIPVHLALKFINNKIMEEYGFYNRSAVDVAIAKKTDMNNLPENEKEIMQTLNAITTAWNTKNYDLFKSISDKNVMFNENGVKKASNQDGYVARMQLFQTGFPDFKVTINSTALKDNKAEVCWTVTGTNTGKLGDAKATGKRIKTKGLSVWIFNKDGKAIQEDAFYDNLAFYQQLGYSLTPPNIEYN